MRPSIKLIIGLGNPGLAYQQTRHNAGTQAVLKLAKKKKFLFKTNRSFKSLIAQGRIRHQIVCLMLPQTYMNLSGEAVQAAVRKKEIALRDILIVCDDVALPLGQIKIRSKGSDGGHNGLASIIEKLATQEIPRLKIGIGKDKACVDLSKYVLSPFEDTERPVLDNVLERAVEAMEAWATEGIEPCMNRFNIKAKE